MNRIQNNKSNQSIKEYEFSYFKRPIRNIYPYNIVRLIDIYNVIKGDYFKSQTDILRKISNKAEARQFKAHNFDYVTFSGMFNMRNNNALIKHSGLIVIDFDNLSDVENTRKQLLNDSELETQLLFISPSGNGLKWVIEVDLSLATHIQYFEGIKNYLLKSYNLEIDNSGKDVTRACFLPHDLEVYINPKHIVL